MCIRCIGREVLADREEGRKDVGGEYRRYFEIINYRMRLHLWSWSWREREREEFYSYFYYDP